MSQAVQNAVRDHGQSSSCWCCGKEHPESRLVHLGTHPEVAVCLNCADFLAHRAIARRDEMHPTVLGRTRDVIRTARGVVVEHGWHTNRFLGPALRWVARHLP